MMNEKADNIIKLLHGHPGPFLEDDKSFFGKKNVDTTMKDKGMQTDCGGMVITKSLITYGDADEIAKNVDLKHLHEFIKKADSELNDLVWPNSKWPLSCYWKRSEKYPEGYYIGDIWWVIYSYLATNKLIPKDNPNSYDNSMEYLYDEILKRLCSEALIKNYNNKWEYFKITT